MNAIAALFRSGNIGITSLLSAVLPDQLDPVSSEAGENPTDANAQFALGKKYYFGDDVNSLQTRDIHLPSTGLD